VLAGVRRHLGLKPGWPLLLVAFCVIAAIHAAPFVQASVANRLITFYPMIMALNLAVVLALWRAPSGDIKPAYWPLLLIEAFFFLQVLVRLWFVVAYDQLTLTFMGSQFAQTSGSLAILLFLSVATMGCALIVIRHQELALRRASRTDALTGWLNRHALQDVAEHELRRSSDGNHSLACILFDIDHFKSINDSHGHTVGDHALRHVAALATTSLRGCDARFRIGGEEFVALIADTDRARALALAERLRAAIESSPLDVDGRSIAITVSVGVAIRSPSDVTWEDLLRRADQALYESKGSGRNRVGFADEPRMRDASYGSAVRVGA
jgi:diguanylate cyclase (GGDEF)-like protein